MALSAAQKARLKAAAEQAAVTEKETGFPCEIVIAQWALESGWGASQPGNNCFGHKAPILLRDNSKRQLLVTKEWFNQGELQHFLGLGDGRIAKEDTNIAPRNGRRRYTVKDWFMRYASLAEAFSVHARKLQSGRYLPAWTRFQLDHDPIELASGIHRAGYATAPDYADTLARLVRNPEVQSAITEARTPAVSPARRSVRAVKKTKPAAAKTARKTAAGRKVLAKAKK